MYRNGGMGPRGPMNRGRGPMSGRPGFGPGMGFGPDRGMHHRPMGFGPGYRPMGMWGRRSRRPMMGFFPMGGLFILPALMFGGWIVMVVLGSILGLVGSIIGGVFEGLASLASGAFSIGSVAVGVVIGLVAFAMIRNRKKEEAFRQENTGSVDGVEVEQVIEPEKTYRANY